MKKGWQTKKLGELLAVVRNGVNCKQDKSGRGDKVSRIESIADAKFDVERVGYAQLNEREKERFLLQQGDILFSHINSAIHVGKTAVFDSDEEVYHGVNLLLMRPSSEVTSGYLEHFLKFLFQAGYWRRVCKQSVNQASVNQQDISRVQVTFPTSLAEQQRIVGILDEAFGGLATAQAHAAQNLQNARDLFESHLNAVFTTQGEGWTMVKIDDLAELARGHNPPKSKFSREEKPGYVRFYQIRDGGTDEYAVFVPDTPQLHKMKKDDIMMVAYRHVGRAFRGVEGAFNVALCKISNARRDLLDDDYLFHIIPSKFVKGELLKRSERSLIPSMSIEHLRELKIPLPPLMEQQRIVKTINALSSETQQLTQIYEQKLAALAELKKSLLHQAFSGEL